MPALAAIKREQWSDYTPLFPTSVQPKSIEENTIAVATIANGKLTLSPTPVILDQFQAWLCNNTLTPANAVILNRCRGFIIYQRPVDSYNRACFYLSKAMPAEALAELDTAINQQASLLGEINDQIEKRYTRYANIRNRVFHNNEEHEMKLALELALQHGLKLWEIIK
jgi:hypothetical protein